MSVMFLWMTVVQILQGHLTETLVSKSMLFSLFLFVFWKDEAEVATEVLTSPNPSLCFLLFFLGGGGVKFDIMICLCWKEDIALLLNLCVFVVVIVVLLHLFVVFAVGVQAGLFFGEIQAFLCLSLFKSL